MLQDHENAGLFRFALEVGVGIGLLPTSTESELGREHIAEIGRKRATASNFARPDPLEHVDQRPRR
ncbi:hypothetical protein XH81_04370 [Bradyrhizobium sp. CCBAU 25360]|nr:hypothetical protein [Bradyrhizobium sp. CCBAU 25360]